MGCNQGTHDKTPKKMLRENREDLFIFRFNRVYLNYEEIESIWTLLVGVGLLNRSERT